ncbi:MAG: hypothetical protein LHW46_07040 [Candidatus Cloacimonetes bacterium]|nr:hypothetical protein [Candidatus Cloacimonadota bacterium]
MIILSIPYRNNQSHISTSQADLIEYRLDYCDDPELIDFAQFDHNTILTYRGLDSHSALFMSMLESSALVDIDFSALPHFDFEIYTTKLIVSIHLDSFDATTINDLLNYDLPVYARKIIINAQSFQDILDTYTIIRSSGKQRVLFNISGKWSIFQRSLYRFFDSMGVYLYYQESTYPGQLSLQDFQLIGGDLITPASALYAIVGGKQVNQSQSMKAYNTMFRKQKLNAHYLPIPAVNPQEALDVLNWLASHFTLKGISITSPFKQSLAEMMGITNEIINTMGFNPKVHPVRPAFWVNTDLDALRESLNKLLIQTSESILIYGSGACAEAFILKLQQWGYTNLFIRSRNTQKSAHLREKYLIAESSLTNVRLLINASPVLNFDHEPGLSLPHFEALIELPYSHNVSSSLIQYCQRHDIPYISGLDFFDTQFIAQCKLLGYRNNAVTMWSQK